MNQYPQNFAYIEKSYIAQWIRNKNPVIIEAGAHKGRDTLALHATWPESIIHAFEPVPALFEQLCLNTSHLGNIHRYQKALSYKTEQKIFYVSDEHCTAISSLLKPLPFFKKGREITFQSTEIQATTLDDWARANDIKSIDLMWLDMQGAELSVLQASPAILKTVKAIHMEVNLEERYQKSPLYPEIKTWLESQNFTLVAQAFYRKSWGNILCVRI